MGGHVAVEHSGTLETAGQLLQEVQFKGNCLEWEVFIRRH